MSREKKKIGDFSSWGTQELLHYLFPTSSLTPFHPSFKPSLFNPSSSFPLFLLLHISFFLLSTLPYSPPNPSFSPISNSFLSCCFLPLHLPTSFHSPFPLPSSFTSFSSHPSFKPSFPSPTFFIPPFLACLLIHSFFISLSLYLTPIFPFSLLFFPLISFLFMYSTSTRFFLSYVSSSSFLPSFCPLLLTFLSPCFKLLASFLFTFEPSLLPLLFSPPSLVSFPLFNPHPSCPLLFFPFFSLFFLNSPLLLLPSLLPLSSPSSNPFSLSFSLLPSSSSLHFPPFFLPSLSHLLSFHINPPPLFPHILRIHFSFPPFPPPYSSSSSLSPNHSLRFHSRLIWQTIFSISFFHRHPPPFIPPSFFSSLIFPSSAYSRHPQKAEIDLITNCAKTNRS